MAGVNAVDRPISRGIKAVLVKLCAVGVLLLLSATFGCSGCEKNKTEKVEPKAVEQKTEPAPLPATKISPTKEAQPAKHSGAAPAIIPNVAKAPEDKELPKVQQAYRPPPTLGLTLNEFCLRFNANAEHLKSKLQIRNFAATPGQSQDSYKHVFNENLYLIALVNKADGSLAEINLVGELTGSLATTVDLNQGIGAIITAFIPSLTPAARESILDSLGINKITSGIYNLEEQVSRNGITYWVKSSRKTGLHFGVRNS